MRKKISIIAIMATIAIATAWNMNVTKERVALNDILLSNVEALAGCETFGGLVSGPQVMAVAALVEEWDAALVIINDIGLLRTCKNI